MTSDEWNAYCQWRPAFEDVIDQRRYSIEWLDHQILSGKAFFLGTEAAAVVYELKEYPTGAIDLHGLIAAGDLGIIRDVLIPGCVERARSLNCLAAVISSRPGWAKALKEDGFELYQVEIRKEF